MATAKDFHNGVKPNWCPGCGDYSVQAAIERAAANLALEPHNLTVVSGIGCSSRISGYLYAYGFHSVHGRALPVAQGIKLANPKLTVLAAGGDGDGCAIGLNHTLHAIRRNIDITYIMMDNHIYGLTKGQASPRSDMGFQTKTTPSGAIEAPLSILEVALGAGATFVAQGFSTDLASVTTLIEQGIRHPGFALINIFSPCVTFNKVNTYEWFRERLTKLDDLPYYDPADRSAAWRAISEYNGLITGLLYQNTDRPAYQELLPQVNPGALADKALPLAPSVFESLLNNFK